MSSSRSIAAARNRRAGEIANPQQRRPNTSINSHAAFAQPNLQRNLTQQQISNSNQNFRNQQQPQFQQPHFQQPPLTPHYEPENKQKKIILASQIPPNTKLSVSDAIGLITLRLGSVEQFIIDLKSEDNSVNKDLPNNTTVIDNSVLTSIINRIDSLEKKEISNTVILNDFKNDHDKFIHFINEKFTYYDNMIQNINNSIEELHDKFNVFENISIDEQNQDQQDQQDQEQYKDQQEQQEQEDQQDQQDQEEQQEQQEQEEQELNEEE